MSKHQITHFAAITGRATDHVTGQPVTGARVEIVAAPAEFRLRNQPYGNKIAPAMLTHTDPDGHFHFLDLPNGNYELQVSAPRTQPVFLKVPVARLPEGGAAPKIADVTLQITPLPDAQTKPSGPNRSGGRRTKSSG